MRKRYYLFTLKYKINQDKDLKLFDKTFVEINRLICKIIYNNKNYPLKEKFDDIDKEKEYKKKDIFSIKLRIFNNFINAKSMFKDCDSLLSMEEDNKMVINFRPTFKNSKSELSHLLE